MQKKPIELRVQGISEDEANLIQIKKMIDQLWSGSNEKRLIKLQNQIIKSVEKDCSAEFGIKMTQFSKQINLLLGLHKATEKNLFDMMEHYRIGVEYYQENQIELKNKFKELLNEAYRDCAEMRYTNSSYAIQKFSAKKEDILLKSKNKVKNLSLIKGMIRIE